MRALVVGASGLVGRAILQTLAPDATGTYLTRPRPGLRMLDARDERSFRDAVRDARAEVIYLPAAQPNVEWCELHPDEARSLNIDPIRVALSVADGRPIVAFSTDYVFDGQAGPYVETHATAPLNVYGRIKLELEDMLLAADHIAVRTTGVFGMEDGAPKNFVLRLIDSLRRGDQVRVPDDQVATPTYAPDLAKASINITASGARGLWHVAGPDFVSRTELSRRVAAAFGLRPDLIVGVPTSELGQVARRPLRGGLLCPRYEATFGPAGRSLDAALQDLREMLAAM